MHWTESKQNSSSHPAASSGRDRTIHEIFWRGRNGNWRNTSTKWEVLVKNCQRLNYIFNKKIKTSKIFLGIEKREEYGLPTDTPFIVEVSRYSIAKLITIVREVSNKDFTYYKLFGENNLSDEDSRDFWFDDRLVDKYTSQISNSFEVWIPVEEAPLLINHIKQDLRILISPKIRR